MPGRKIRGQTQALIYLLRPRFLPVSSCLLRQACLLQAGVMVFYIKDKYFWRRPDTGLPETRTHVSG